MVPPTIRQIIDTPANAPMTLGKTVDCLGAAMAPEAVEVPDGSDALEVEIEAGTEVEGGEKERVVIGVGASAVEDGMKREVMLMIEEVAEIAVLD